MNSTFIIILVSFNFFYKIQVELVEKNLPSLDQIIMEKRDDSKLVGKELNLP